MARPALEYPLPFRILRTLFPVLQKIAPKTALSLAVRLFLTPIRFATTKKQKELQASFSQKTLQLNGKAIVVYQKGTGPEVICLHGWSGRAMQFAHIADLLASEGYTAVLIDAPGHGLSEGGRTNLFEFAESLELVMAQCDDLKAVVGHSLGAASISYAISEGLKVPAFASFGAPVIAQDILDEFARRINATDDIFIGIRQKAVERFGKTFDGVAMEHTFKKVNCPVIGFHGEQDLDVPLYHLSVLKNILPDMETHSFSGIGHRRILKDERVMPIFIDWIIRLE